MEDAIDAIEQLGSDFETEFYAVYDGHSGTHAVEFVKRCLPGAVRNHRYFGDPSRICDALCEAFTVTDEELLEMIRLQPRPRRKSSLALAVLDGSSTEDGTRLELYSNNALSAGCVTCVAVVRGSRLHVANLGDCRAVLCCRGEMRALTVDHNPQNNEIERERLGELGVEVSSDGYLHGRIGVSRAFGDWAWDAEEKCLGLLCLPVVTEAEIASDTEFLLLACDGVFEKMSTTEAGQIVRRSLRAKGEAKVAAEALVRNAEKRNGTDNLSAVVVLFNLPPSTTTERSAPRLFRTKLQEELGRTEA